MSKRRKISDESDDDDSDIEFTGMGESQGEPSTPGPSTPPVRRRPAPEEFLTPNTKRIRVSDEEQTQRRMASSQRGMSQVFQSQAAEAEINLQLKWKKGNIKEIRMHNFKSYDDVVVNPGPTLNVVVGPNGCGKSSIVDAICLGLGGAPRLLGSSDELKGFVKRGTASDTAFVEITLYGGDGKKDIVIKRSFERHTNLSKWEIGGKKSNSKNVLELVGKLKIQVANQVQFVPQSKFKEMKQSSKQRILHFTQEAVGPSGHSDLHKELINMQADRVKMEQAMEARRVQIGKLEKNNENIKRDVERYRERQKKKDKMDLVEKWIPWCEMEKLRVQYIEAGERVEEAKEVLKQMDLSKQPLKQEIDTLKKEMNAAKTKEGRATLKEKEHKAEFKKLSNKLDHMATTMDQIDVDLEEYKEEVAEKRKRRSGYVREQIEKTKEYEALKAQISQQGADVAAEKAEAIKAVNKAKRVRQRVQESIGELTQQTKLVTAEILQLQRKLDKASTVTEQRKQVLFEKFDTYPRGNLKKCNAWIEKAKSENKFHGEVFGPLITELTVKDPLVQQYVEQAIPQAEMKAFVCTDRRDTKTIMDELRTVQKLQPTVLNPHIAAGNPPPQRVCDINTLKQYGIHYWLDEAVEGPPIIMQFLRDLKFHTMAVGDDSSNDQRDKIFEKTPVTQLFNLKGRNMRMAAYSGKNWTKTDPLRNSQILHVGTTSASMNIDVMNQRLQDAIQRKREMKQNIQHQRELNAKATHEVAQAEERRNKLNIQDQAVKKVVKRLATLKLKIADIDGDLKSDAHIEKKIATFATKLKDKKMQHAEVLLQMPPLLVKCQNASRTALVHKLKETALREQIRPKEMMLSRQDGEYRRNVEAYEAANATKKDLKAQTRAKREEAKKRCGITGKDATIPEDLMAEFQKLETDNVDELWAMRDALHLGMRQLYHGNEELIQEYDRRENEIRNLHEEIVEATEPLDLLKARIAEDKEKWLAPLRDLLRKIDVNFRQNMSDCNAIGNVVLDEKGDDFAEYGIDLMVKFRDRGAIRVCLGVGSL